MFRIFLNFLEAVHHHVKQCAVLLIFLREDDRFTAHGQLVAGGCHCTLALVVVICWDVHAVTGREGDVDEGDFLCVWVALEIQVKEIKGAEVRRVLLENTNVDVLPKYW